MDAVPGSGRGCHASSSRSLICVTCGGSVNPYRCHSQGHHIEDLTIDAQDSQALGSLLVSNLVSNLDSANALSGTDISTSFWNSGSSGDASWLRSSGNASEWNTASTGLSSDSAMDVQATAPFETNNTAPSMECELPLVVPNLPQEPSSSKGVEHDARSPTTNSREQESLTAAAEAHLWHLLERCKQEGRGPREREIHGLAMCEDISADMVIGWFCRNFSRPQPSHLIDSHGGQDRSPGHPGQKTPLSEDTVLQQVEEYARQRYSQDCSNPHSRKSAEAGGRYKCTSGCGFSTNIRNAWQRHEELRQPQDFWSCIVCRSLGQRADVCSRNNHLNQHLANRHKEIPKNEHNRLRDESKVPFENGFERYCTFFNGSGPCRYHFKSWKDRIQHYLHHFNDKIRDGPWTLRFHGRGWLGDDEDKDGRGSGAGTSGSSGSGWSSNLQSQSGTKSSQNSQHMQVSSGYSYALDVSLRKTTVTPMFDTSSKNIGNPATLPGILIDVVNLAWSHASPESKYVAFEHSTEHFISHRPAVPNADALRDMSHSCSPFKEVLSIVRNMGYTLLWINELCESGNDAKRTQALYERAVLTVVLVSSPQQANQISHYTCHYHNIEQVRAWAVQSLPIMHVQNLGHGAFGIVDEVRFGAASDIYARKMLLGPKAHKMLKAIQFREIEIMQKLRHQNIAEFIAAYFDRRSLNILMRPVAECSLSELLAEPSRWAAKLQHISRWMCSLASAVSYMHGLSLRHKDIKPANILIKDDDVYLSDFGASMDFSHHESKSEGDALMTPRYCAPEVARRDYRGRKADIFSLGCVFLELATVDRGRSLDDADRFLGHSGNKAGMKISYCTSLKACGHWIDVLLEGNPSHYQRTSLNLCQEMLAHDPNDRPNAWTVHDQLMSASSSLPSTPRSNDLAVLGSWSYLNARARNDAPNILVKHDGACDVLRISDFGSGCVRGQKRFAFSFGILGRLALAADVWSLGLVFAEALIWMARGHAKASKQHSRSLGDQATYGPTAPAWSDAGDHLNVVPDDAWPRSAKENMISDRFDAGGLTMPSTTETRKGLLKLDPLQKRHDIRLLQIRPSKDFDAPLECELVVASLDTDVQYQALSYCWGSGRKHQIQCNDKKVFVPKNLPKVLRQIRQGGLPGEGRYLWVDAICIDQDDPQEWLHQFELMEEIYTRAERVIVWLEGSPQVKTSWHSRRWMIQECSLARKITMLFSYDCESVQLPSVATQHAGEEEFAIPCEVHEALHNSAMAVRRSPLDTDTTAFILAIRRLIFGVAQIWEEEPSDLKSRLADKVNKDAEFEDVVWEALEAMYQRSDGANIWLRKLSGWS